MTTGSGMKFYKDGELHHEIKAEGTFAIDPDTPRPNLGAAVKEIQPSDRELMQMSLDYLIEFGMGEMPTAKALRERLAQPEPPATIWLTFHEPPMVFRNREDALAFCQDGEQPIPMYSSPLSIETAVKAERDRCLKILLKLHKDNQYRHNYYLYAARQIDDEQVDFRGDFHGDFRGDFRGDEECIQISDKVKEDTVCKTHPDAPHGFDRNASLSEDRYVCECESWEPPEPEPVAWMKVWKGGYKNLYDYKPPFYNDKEIQPLYTAPPKREWVGLTDDEFQACFDHADGTLGSLMYAIEAKLKEKNT